MREELIDYNPMFGRYTFAGDDPHTGDTVIREVYDKRHALAGRDRAQARAADNIGRGESMRLAFSLTPYLQVELMEKYGLDARNRDHWEGIFAVVRRDYPKIIENT